MTNKQRSYWECHPDLKSTKNMEIEDAQEIEAEDNKVKSKKGEKSDDSITKPVLG